MGLPLNNTGMEILCSEGFEIINGRCLPIDSITSSTEIETSSNPSENIIIHEEKPATKITGACPKGTEHGKHGICQEIEHFDTTEVTDKSTTDLNEHGGSVEDLKGCPQGTEPDEQGACQETKPFKPTKTGTDPKSLLNKDGSCPDNYKMIDGQCLYIKPKINRTLYPSGLPANNDVSILKRPRSGNDESSKVELVPVLADNSCPEDTEYSEYGLCRKRIHLSNSNLHIKPDGSCPDNFELINGKCSHKNFKIQVKPGFPTTTSVSESTKHVEEEFNNDKFLKSTTTAYEFQPEATSSPF